MLKASGNRWRPSGLVSPVPDGLLFWCTIKIWSVVLNGKASVLKTDGGESPMGVRIPHAPKLFEILQAIDPVILPGSYPGEQRPTRWPAINALSWAPGVMVSTLLS